MFIFGPIKGGNEYFAGLHFQPMSADPAEYMGLVYNILHFWSDWSQGDKIGQRL